MKKLLTVFCAVLLIFSLSFSAFAQQVKSIDSTLTDAAQEPLYTVNKEKTAVYYDEETNEEIVVFEKVYNCDISGDGKTTIVDVKQILKHIAKISEVDESKIPYADLDQNGKLTIADAKAILGIIAGLRTYYILEDEQTIPNGFFKDDSGNKVYFNEQGMLVKGLVTINGNKYLFTAQGILLRNGIHNYSGHSYLVLEDDTIAINGLYKYNKNTYLANENGELLKGIQKFNGKSYLLDDNFRLVINSSAVVGGVRYYTDKNGVLLNGEVRKIDGTYYYENGVPFNGWRYPGLDMFYYDKNGKLVTNTTIGDFTFDSKGNPSATVINHNTLKYHLRKILKENGSDPKSIFDYVSDHSIFSYKIMDKGASAEEMVIYMLKYHKGSCYQFAYLTQALYREAGYECEVVIGTVMSTISNSRSTHYWNKVKFPDGWYYVDTEYPWKEGGTYKKTAEEMKELSYRW